MTYEEAEARYLAAMERNDAERMEMAVAARRVREGFGRDALKSLARNAHRRVAALNLEADVGGMVTLTEGRPTVTFDHLAVLRKESDPETWLDLAEDESLSPADLRRRLAVAKRQASDPEKIKAKAGVLSEKMKVLVDEAVPAGVLLDVADRAESAAQYARAKRNGI